MRAVIYARISDDRTGLAAGVKRQEDDARALCVRNGWDVVGVEVDNDISASRYSRKVRPAYQRVLAMAGSGEVDVIACYDVDRLYRRPAELEDLIDVAERTLIASVQGDLRLDTADGRAMARILCAMAAKSSDDTSRRVKRKHRATAEAGLPSLAGSRPFGFEDDRITHRESEVQRIREAAARILGGDSLGAICRDWSEAGVLTAKGNRWQTSVMRRMLEAPRLVGLRAVAGEVIGPAVWEPVLERETWDALRATFAGRRAVMVGGANKAARTYLLSGLIFCESCGVPMGGHNQPSRGKARKRYWCHVLDGGCNRVGISAPRTEEFVVDILLTIIGNTGTATPGDRIDIAGGPVLELARQETQLQELAAALAEERIDFATFEAAAGRIRARVSELQSQMARIPGRGVVADLADSADPAAFWEAMPFDRKRAAVAEVFERIDIAPSSGRGSGFEGGRITPVRR